MEQKETGDLIMYKPDIKSNYDTFRIQSRALDIKMKKIGWNLFEVNGEMANRELSSTFAYILHGWHVAATDFCHSSRVFTSRPFLDF